MSTSPSSFRFPSGRDCPLDRAIVFNGNITWRHALTKQSHHWVGLRLEHVAGIARLARVLQDIERGMGPAKRWSPACWHVLQWWEPSLENWSSGRRALITPLRHGPLAALELLERSPLRTALRGSSIEVLIPRRLSRQRDS